MPIELTAKIDPKNDGFQGLVDDDQVIDTQTNTGNHLVSDGTYFGSIAPFDAIDLVKFSAFISPAQITSQQDDYNPTGLSSTSSIRLNTDASQDITGLQGGASGRILLIHNVGAQDIVLKDENASSTAANRFALNSDVTVEADNLVLLQYDNTSSRWRVVAGGGSAGSKIEDSDGDTYVDVEETADEDVINFVTQNNHRMELHDSELILRVPIKATLNIGFSTILAALNIIPIDAPPTNASPLLGDTYLDDGTNTGSGNPGWRIYNGAAWEDIGVSLGSNDGEILEWNGTIWVPTLMSGSSWPAVVYAGKEFLRDDRGPIRYVLKSISPDIWSPLESIGDVNIYISKSGTDDKDHGFGSGSDAFLTLTGANYGTINQIPGSVGGNLIVNIDNGTYSEAPVFKGKYVTGPFSIKILGTYAANSGPYTADIFSTTTIGKTGSGWSVNAFKSKIVRITGGTGIGKYCVISSNTADTITIVGEWRRAYDPLTGEGGVLTPTAPDGTSVFVVEDFGTKITGTNSDVGLGPCIHVPTQQNITFQRIWAAGLGGSFNSGMRLDASHVSHYGCKFTGDIPFAPYKNSVFESRSCLMTAATHGSTGGIDMKGSTGEFDNCRFADNTGRGLMIRIGSNLEMFSNELDNNSSHGIEIQSSAALRGNGVGVSKNNGGWGLMSASGGVATAVQGWTYSGNVSGSYTPTTQLVGGTD